MQEKYEKLFFEFEPQETHWGDWCHSPQAYFRGDRDMPGAAMNGGFQVFKKATLFEREPHFHREDEYLIFLGSVLPDVFASFDAEIHFYMGKTLDTMEKIVITEPTVVKIPKGWYHCPLTLVRIDKPILFQAIMLSGRAGWVKAVEMSNGERYHIYVGDETRLCVFDSHKKCNHCGYCFSHPDERPKKPYTFVKWTVVNEDGVECYTDAGAYDPSKAPLGADCIITKTNKSKPYSDATKLNAPKPPLTPELAKCVLAVPKEETKWGSWCPSPQAYFRGETYMEGATYHVGWQTFSGTHHMEDPHIHQGVEEYLYFMGADMMNIFDFDAEIEVFLGDDPDHMESKIITKPTVVRIPPNVWHCPILFNAKKPVLFQAAFLAGTWGTIIRNPDPEHMTERIKAKYYSREHSYCYIGDDVRPCKLDSSKRCNVCGRCWKLG